MKNFVTGANRRKLTRMRNRWIKDAAFFESLFPVKDWENSIDDHHDVRRNLETAIAWMRGVLARRIPAVSSQHENTEAK